MPKRRSVLLRIANVNPDSVNTHSDRVLYRAIGVFIVLYFGYATAGGAAFIDASVSYAHPWWQWLVGPLVATGVVAYDRAVVGRVGIGFERLDSADPQHLLKRPTPGLYLGRLGLALLFAVIITEPLMLARYQGEIDARLNQVHNQRIAAAESGGAVALYGERLAQLTALTADDDKSVAALTTAAAGKRRDARTLYRQAIADSAGGGVSRKRGCPAGGYCDALVKRSRGLDDKAVALDARAATLQETQRPVRSARAAEAADLTTKINAQRTANAAAITADAGFGARTTAMWHLVTSDFWGIGLFYLGIALLLVALDCAAVGLKFVSHGNAYERAEARAARLAEHAAVIALARQIRDAEAYSEAAARVIAGSIEVAAHDVELARTVTERSRARLYAAVIGPHDADYPPAVADLAPDASLGAGDYPATVADLALQASQGDADYSAAVADLVANGRLRGADFPPALANLMPETSPAADADYPATLADIATGAIPVDTAQQAGSAAAQDAGAADAAAAMAGDRELRQPSDPRDRHPDFDAVGA